MLVVDLHALQTIDVLHFVDDVASKLLDAQQTQDVVRISGAFDDFFAALHHLTIVHQDLLVLADEELVLGTIVVRDDEALLALGFLAERDRTGLLGEHAGILRAAGFKELGHARQTTRNITSLLAFTRDTGKHLALMDFLAVANDDDGAHGQLDRHGVIRTRNLHLFALFVDEVHHRTHHVGDGRRLRAALAALGDGRALRIDHHHRAQAGDFVDLIHHGDVFDHVFKAHRTGVFGHDRQRHRIERRELLAGLHFLIRSDQERGAVGTLWRSRSRPVSASLMMSSPEREMTMSSLLPFCT